MGSNSYGTYASIGIIAMLLSSLCFSNSSSTSYERTVTFSPIRLSVAELSRALLRIQSFVSSANAGAGDQDADQNLKLGSQDRKLSIVGDLATADLSSAEPVSGVMEFAYSKHGGAVSRVSIIFNDDIRLLIVEGGSREQVDGLVAMLTEVFRRHEVALGGSLFRNFFGPVALIVSLALAAAVSFIPRIKSRLAAVLSIFNLVLVVVSLFLTSRSWLPGFAVYSGDASFVVRNAAAISFYGLIATLITFAIGTALSWRWSRRSDLAGEKPNNGMNPSAGGEGMAR